MIILITVLSLILVSGRILFKDERDNQLFNSVMAFVSIGMIPILSFNWAQEFSFKSVLFLLIIISISLIPKLETIKIVMVLLSYLVQILFPQFDAISVMLAVLILTINKDNQISNYIKVVSVVLIYTIDISLMDSILFLVISILMFFDHSSIEKNMSLERILPLVLIASSHEFSYAWPSEVIVTILMLIAILYVCLGSQKNSLRNSISLIVIFSLLLFDESSFVALGTFLICALALSDILEKTLSSMKAFKERDNTVHELLLGTGISIVPIFTLFLTGATQSLMLLSCMFVVIYIQTAFYRASVKNVKHKDNYLFNGIYVLSFFVVFLPFLNNDYSWLGLKSLPHFAYSFEIWNGDKSLVLVALFLLYVLTEFAKYKKPELLKKYKFKYGFFGDNFARNIAVTINSMESKNIITFGRSQSAKKGVSFKDFVGSIVETSVTNLNFIIWTTILVLTILLVCAI